LTQPLTGVVDPVHSHCGLISPLGRKADRTVLIELHSMTQKRTQLVLGGYNSDAFACAIKLGKHCRSPEPAGVVHHHSLARVRVDQEVPADPVHFGRASRGDGHVVGVGEGRDHRMGDPVSAHITHALEIGHQTCGDGLVQIGRFAPVQTNGDGAGLRHRIGAVVDR